MVYAHYGYIPLEKFILNIEKFINVSDILLLLTKHFYNLIIFKKIKKISINFDGLNFDGLGGLGRSYVQCLRGVAGSVHV